MERARLAGMFAGGGQIVHRRIHLVPRRLELLVRSDAGAYIGNRPRFNIACGARGSTQLTQSRGIRIGEIHRIRNHRRGKPRLAGTVVLGTTLPLLAGAPVQLGEQIGCAALLNRAYHLIHRIGGAFMPVRRAHVVHRIGKRHHGMGHIGVAVQFRRGAEDGGKLRGIAQRTGKMRGVGIDICIDVGVERLSMRLGTCRDGLLGQFLLMVAKRFELPYQRLVALRADVRQSIDQCGCAMGQTGKIPFETVDCGIISGDIVHSAIRDTAGASGVAIGGCRHRGDRQRAHREFPRRHVCGEVDVIPCSAYRGHQRPRIVGRHDRAVGRGHVVAHTHRNGEGDHRHQFRGLVMICGGESHMDADHSGSAGNPGSCHIGTVQGEVHMDLPWQSHRACGHMARPGGVLGTACDGVLRRTVAVGTIISGAIGGTRSQVQPSRLIRAAIGAHHIGFGRLLGIGIRLADGIMNVSHADRADRHAAKHGHGDRRREFAASHGAVPPTFPEHAQLPRTSHTEPRNRPQKTFAIRHSKVFNVMRGMPQIGARMPENVENQLKTDISGEDVEHAGIATGIGDALMTALGFGHHEFAIHLGDVRIQSGTDRDAVQPLDLVMLALVVGRSEARTRLQHPHLRRVFESFREQGDDGRIDVVDGLAQ